MNIETNPQRETKKPMAHLLQTFEDGTANHDTMGLVAMDKKVIGRCNHQWHGLKWHGELAIRQLSVQDCLLIRSLRCNDSGVGEEVIRICGTIFSCRIYGGRDSPELPVKSSRKNCKER
jgi:hypothetical protein